MIDYCIVPLRELLVTENINMEKLDLAFKEFSCNRETDLEDFLLRRVIQYEKSNFGRTFLFLDMEKLNLNEFQIAAFFTIAITSVNLEDVSKNKRCNMLGNYPGRDGLKSCSAFLIGQIRRCDCYTSNDLPGEIILNECYSVIKQVNLQILY